MAAADHRPTRPAFEPQSIGKHERRFTGLDDKILAWYARGLSVRQIQAFLQERYDVAVSPDLISTVTDAVVAEVPAWQTRPLEPPFFAFPPDMRRVIATTNALERVHARIRKVIKTRGQWYEDRFTKALV